MPAPIGYKIRFPKEGSPPARHGTIAFKEKHWKVFRNVNPQARAQLTSVMRAWCDRGPKDIPITKFKFQEWYERHGKRARLEVFKGHQVRFYGASMQVDGQPMFLVTACDVSKKSDDADDDLLKAAGKTAFQLIHGS
jgi:hypothetical protein